jgi:hypothetical protein
VKAGKKGGEGTTVFAHEMRWRWVVVALELGGRRRRMRVRFRERGFLLRSFVHSFVLCIGLVGMGGGGEVHVESRRGKEV